MTQPGHNIDIYASRYLDSSATITAYAPYENRPGDGAYCEQKTEIATKTDAAGTVYFAAPTAGRIDRVLITSLTLTTAVNTITPVVTNMANSTTVSTTTVFDAGATDGPIVANEAQPVNLSTTNANVICDEGDLIRVVSTVAGTIAGQVVTVIYENY